MGISEKVQKDMADAMRARDERRLSTLRMMKTALKNREVEKRGPLDDREEVQVLNTLIKQRKDSIEQFTRGDRPELAKKEADEIGVIEGYLPQAASEEEIVNTVRSKIAELGSPTMKDMGQVMKSVMAQFQSSGARVDGKLVNEIVRRELSQRAR
jgi:uncharacterized protein YqeY